MALLPEPEQFNPLQRLTIFRSQLEKCVGKFYEHYKLWKINLQWRKEEPTYDMLKDMVEEYLDIDHRETLDQQTPPLGKAAPALLGVLLHPGALHVVVSPGLLLR